MTDPSSRMRRMPDSTTPRRGLRGIWLAFVATVVFGLNPPATRAGGAPEPALCIPVASGVPALGGAPNFIDSAAGEPNYWPRLDDPRWRGSAARSFGTGASEHASFRVLRSGGAEPQLYLSWLVKVDGQLDPTLDSLRVAFSTGADPDVMFEVRPFTTVAANIDAAPPIFTQTRTFVANAWTNTPAAPAWLTPNTRVWLDKASQQWAINMRLPLVSSPADSFNKGLYLPAGTTQFRVAYALQVSQPMNGMVYHSMDPDVTLFDLATMPPANTWPLADIAQAPGSAGCEKTLSLIASDVGTTNTDGGGNPRPNEIKINGVNTFFALVNNETGAPVPANTVSATFRIANWGTQPDWNDVTDPTNTLWRQINSAPVSNGGIIPAGSKSSIAAANAPNFNWTMTTAERCEFTGQAGDPTCPNVNPIRRPHQCMLVELSGGGLSYNPSSVYRNMDFVEASTFEREAQVSVAGISPLGGGKTHRDVFLYVQQLMMPKSADRPDPKPTLLDYAKVREILEGGGSEQPGIAATGHKPPGKGSEIPPRPPLDGEFEVMNQLYPTYLVHAFHDSGKTVTVEGQNRHLLYPQSSFGYYVHHDGALTGWDTALEGTQLIAPNYYKVVVPEGGSTTVKTRVVAREIDPPTHPGIKWWWWLIAFIVLILLFLLLRRKSGP
ncbi:hypothetical protein [Pseudomonas sp. CGJS7]|uniref:hypothetical protein n=1 Tax=Pseudomonas sp. CGJS7 TaxID=3109348 RepID=UPI00300ADD67